MARLLLQRLFGFGATKYVQKQGEGAPCAHAVREAVFATTGAKNTSAKSAKGAASASTVRRGPDVCHARVVVSVSTREKGGGARSARRSWWQSITLTSSEGSPYNSRKKECINKRREYDAPFTEHFVAYTAYTAMLAHNRLLFYCKL